MVDENRAVFAADRNETTVVRAYLEALERERLQADGVGQRGSIEGCLRASDAHQAGAGWIGDSKLNGHSPGAFDTEVDLDGARGRIRRRGIQLWQAPRDLLCGMARGRRRPGGLGEGRDHGYDVAAPAWTSPGPPATWGVVDGLPGWRSPCARSATGGLARHQPARGRPSDPGRYAAWRSDDQRRPCRRAERPCTRGREHAAWHLGVSLRPGDGRHWVPVPQRCVQGHLVAKLVSHAALRDWVP